MTTAILTDTRPTRSARSAAAGALLGAAVSATAASCGHATNRPAADPAPAAECAHRAVIFTPQVGGADHRWGRAVCRPVGVQPPAVDRRRAPGRTGRRPDHRDVVRDVHRER